MLFFSPDQLQLLKGKRGSEVQVIKSSAPKWHELALALKLPSATVNNIQMGSFYQPVPCCRRALDQWITEAPGGKPVTWGTLLLALREAQINDVADDLEKVLKEGIK